MNTEALFAAEWLQYKAFDNRMLDYLLAAGIFLALWIGLNLVKQVALYKLGKLSKLTHNRVDDFFVELLGSINRGVFPIVALYGALHRLTIPEFLDKTVQLITLVVVVYQITVLLTRLADFLIMRLRSGDDPAVRSTQKNIRFIAKGAVWIASVLFLLSNLGVDITTFVTGLGIGGIAVGLALQSVLGDAFSSFTIAVDKPFEIGDFIVVDAMRGNVEHIGLKTTRVRSLDGELLVFSNSDLTSARIRNYKQMNSRRVCFPIGVTYDTPVEKLRQIPAVMRDIITDIDQADFDRCHFLQFADSSLNFETIYHVKTRDYDTYCDIQQNLNLQLAERLQALGVEMAFPTQTIHVASTPQNSTV